MSVAAASGPGLLGPEQGPERLDAVRELAGALGCDAALVTDPYDIAWACGFTGSNGALVVTGTAGHHLTPGP